MRHKPIPKLTKSDLARFWDKVDVQGPDDCWEWTASLRNGYGQFGLNGTIYKAHRVSYTIANGDPGELCVCHLYDNPSCVNPAHLWLGTIQDDIDDCIQKDRQAKGEQQGSAKLTEKQVKEILKSDESQKVLAKKFNVTQSHISRIKLGKEWKHVKGERNFNTAHANSQTKVRGVDPHKATGKYQARITYKGVRYYLGLFKTITKAEQALNKWKERHEL